MSIDLEAIEARSNKFESGEWNTRQDAINCARDIPALLAEVERLNIVLQDERKEHAEEYARLRSTYIREAKRLENELSSITAERDDYRQKWYTSNKCYNAICAERDAAVECLENIHEHTREGGIDGGYPYGATNLLGYKINKIVEEWRDSKGRSGENG